MVKKAAPCYNWNITVKHYYEKFLWQSSRSFYSLMTPVLTDLTLLERPRTQRQNIPFLSLYTFWSGQPVQSGVIYLSSTRLSKPPLWNLIRRHCLPSGSFSERNSSVCTSRCQCNCWPLAPYGQEKDNWQMKLTPSLLISCLNFLSALLIEGMFFYWFGHLLLDFVLALGFNVAFPTDS